MFRFSLPLLPWWNYCTERKVRHVVMYGGQNPDRHRTRLVAAHKIYVKKFKKGTFPNRRRTHWNVTMTGVLRQRPRRMPWPYDICSMVFNQPTTGSDKIGYVVGTKMLKTAVVAANHLVYYPKFNQRVARTSRHFAHDEDMACVDGDLVHIKMCRKISKYKHYYVFSILEPNIEGRERLKMGLPSVAPPLFGYPTSRRVVKLNLSTAGATKEKLASQIQEQVQDFYRFTTTAKGMQALEEREGTTFDEEHAALAPNAPPTSGALEGDGDEQPPLIGSHEDQDELEMDTRTKKGEEYWFKDTDGQGLRGRDVGNFTKTP